MRTAFVSHSPLLSTRPSRRTFSSTTFKCTAQPPPKSAAPPKTSQRSLTRKYPDLSTPSLPDLSPALPSPSLSPLPSSSPSPSPSPSPLDYLWPRLLILLVAAIWGTNFATVKLVQSGTDAVPLPIAALARFSLAALFMTPLAFQEQRVYKKPLPSSWFSHSFLIGLAVTLGYFSQAVSLVTTDANKSAFMCSLAVVIVPLLERLAYKLRISPPPKQQSLLVTWAAPLLAVLGVGLLELDTNTITAGDLWALLQAIGFAAGFIGNAQAATKYPGLTMSTTAVQLIIVAAFSLLWSLGDAWVHGHFLPDLSLAFSTQSNTIAVIYAGVITTAVTVWLENLALVHVGAGELAVLLSTEPLWATAFASITLGEHMAQGGVIGGALILMACLVNQADKLGGKQNWSGVGSALAAMQLVVTQWFDKNPPWVE